MRIMAPIDAEAVPFTFAAVVVDEPVFDGERRRWVR